MWYGQRTLTTTARLGTAKARVFVDTTTDNDPKVLLSLQNHLRTRLCTPFVCQLEAERLSTRASQRIYVISSQNMKKYPNSSDRHVFGALGAPRRLLETPQPSSSRNSVISARFPQVSPRIGSGDVEEGLRSPRPYGLSIPPDMFSSLVDGWTEHPASDPIVEDDLSPRELKNKRRKLNQEEGDALDKLEIPPIQYSNKNDMFDDLHEDGVSCSSKSATKSSVPPAGLISDDSRPILPLQNDVASPRLGNSIPMCTNAFSKYADANRARWRRRKEHWASCSANDWLSGGEGIFDMLACILDRIQQGVEADIQSIDILGHSLDNHSGGILQNREDMLGTAKDALRRNDGFMSNNHATSETAN